MYKIFFASVMAVSAASVAMANPYVSGKIGFADLVVDTDQYMYHTPDAYKSTVVDGKINDINAAYRAALGYDFGQIRVEAEYGYGRYAMSGGWSLNTKNGVPDSLPPNLSYPATYTLVDKVNTFMLNAYYNLFIFGRRYENAVYTDINLIEPYTYNSFYLMAGIGMAHTKEKGQVAIDTTMAWGGEPLYETADNTLNRFIYGVGFGLNFGLTANISTDVSYRYTKLGNYHIGTTRRDYSSHEIMLGLRYEF